MLMQSYQKIVLEPLQYMFVLFVPDNGLSLISEYDQFYLYEAVAVMIVSGDFTLQEEEMFSSNILIPVLDKFRTIISKLFVESDEQNPELLPQYSCHVMAETSRVSKAFISHQQMKSWSCVPVFIEVFKVILECLQIPSQIMSTLKGEVWQFPHQTLVILVEELLAYTLHAYEGLFKGHDIQNNKAYIHLIVQIIGKLKIPKQTSTILNGVGQFLHRMVVWLKEELLACIPQASEGLLKEHDIHSIQEYVTLIVILMKFKGDEFLNYLHGEYLPTMQISPDRIDEFHHAIKADNKVTKLRKCFHMLGHDKGKRA